MFTSVMPNPKQQFFDNNGLPLVGGLVYTYAAGTTTPKDTYIDEDGTEAQPNPIPLNFRGEPESTIRWNGSYRVEVYDVSGNLVYTVDDYNSDPAGLWGLVVTLLSAVGSTMIGFLQAGIGAVLMTIQAKLRQSVHIQDFGAVGDGVANDTAAIQAALNASLHVDFGNFNCKVAGVLQLRTGHFLHGKRATLTQTITNTEIFNFEGLSDVRALGLKCVGMSDYIDSDSSRAVAFYGGTSGTNNHFSKCHFLNFGYTPVRFKAQTNCSFTFNTVIGPGSPTLTPVTSGKNYGVLADSGCIGILVLGNDISYTAQGVITNEASQVRIIGNRLHDITGQHGVYAGAGLSNCVIANNTVYNVDLVGIKVQAQDYAGMDNFNISVVGNSIYDCGDQGILICNAIVASTYKCRNVTVSGNSVRLVAGSCINLNSTNGANVVGNTLDLAGQSGVVWGESSNLKIESNLITRAGLSGMRDGIASTGIDLTNNKIVDCATAGQAGDQYGIFVQFGSDYNISKNRISDANAKVVYGIWLVGPTNSTVSLDDNTVTEATQAGLRLSSTAALRSYKGNYFAGTLAASTGEPLAPSVASAAAIVLPPKHDVVTITGASPITSISAQGHSGHRVQLILAAGVTMTDGSNLKLAGNLVATADDTITIGCDGVNWYEACRSLN